MKKVKPNFVISHRGALGDFLFTWPIIISLRWKFPDHQFIGLGKPEFISLAETFGILDRGIDCEKKELLPFYQGESLPKSLLPLDIFLGWIMPDPKLKELLGQSNLEKYYLHPPFPDKGGTHIIDYHMKILEAFDVPPLENKDLYLPLTSGVEEKCVIHPGSGDERKNFDPEFYVFIANELRAWGYPHITFVLGPNEKSLKSKLGMDYKISEPQNPTELARMLTGSRLFIGNDSGVSHLAAFLGIKTLALYKTTSPSVWGTTGIQAENVEAPTEAQAMAQIQKILGKIPKK